MPCRNPGDHPPHEYLADADAIAFTPCPGSGTCWRCGCTMPAGECDCCRPPRGTVTRLTTWAAPYTEHYWRGVVGRDTDPGGAWYTFALRWADAYNATVNEVRRRQSCTGNP